VRLRFFRFRFRFRFRFASRFFYDHVHDHNSFFFFLVWLGISQRDTNYYGFLNEPGTQREIVSSFVEYWTAHVKPKWPTTTTTAAAGPTSCTYGLHRLHRRSRLPIRSTGWFWALLHSDTLDVLLTRDLTRFHIIDFNPYAPRTDPLLFTYEELASLFATAAAITTTPVPTLRVIDSPAHPAATRNAPQYQHNMVPLEALTLSEGRNMEEFADAWMEQVRRGAVDSDEDEERWRWALGQLDCWKLSPVFWPT
jgi:hypothetical protein